MMRRIIGAVAVVAAFLIVQAAPASAAVTITAKAVGKPTCRNGARIEGGVLPVGATRRVVLQRTVGGKWQDWKWWNSGEESTWAKPHLLTDVPESFEQGHYSIQYLGSVKASIIHLRVRSNGGSVVSPGVYVKSTC